MSMTTLWDRDLVRHALEKERGAFSLTEVATRDDFEALVEEPRYDIVVSDFNILGFEGLEVIQAVKSKCPRVPVIIVTGTGSEEIAVEAMKMGASDYVIKSPSHIRRLPGTISAVLKKDHLESALSDSEEAFRSLFKNSMDATLLTAPDGRIFKANPAACKMFGMSEDEICRAGQGPTDRPYGPKGTGPVGTAEAMGKRMWGVASVSKRRHVVPCRSGQLHIHGLNGRPKDEHEHPRHFCSQRV